MATGYDYDMLNQTLRLARESAGEECAPVGTLLVRSEDGHILGRSRSHIRPAGDGVKDRPSIAHAELSLLISCQSEMVGGWTYTVFTSLEPCVMCMGAIIVARISRVVWAVDDYWAGGSKLYDAGKQYVKARMPELVRTPFKDLQEQGARMWREHLIDAGLDTYVERMLRWQWAMES